MSKFSQTSSTTAMCWFAPTAREHAAGILILGAAAAVCFHMIVLDPSGLLVGPQRNGNNDLTSPFLAFRDWPATAVYRWGQFPWWNPFDMGGAPWLGNPQSALFYPPNWLFLLAPVQAVISWLLVLHHLWGGIGAYLVCRRLQLGWFAAVTGGVVFLAAPYMVAHTGEGHYNQVCLYAWIPWAFWALERWRATARGASTGVALVLALSFFCGHIQEVFYLGVALSGWVVCDAVRALRATPSVGVRRLGLWMLTLVFAAGFVAVEFLPQWLYARQTVRHGGLSLADAGHGLDLRHLRLLLNPMALGGPQNVSSIHEFYWENLSYFGVVPLLLAAGGLIAHRRVYPAARLFWLAALAIGFAFGSGSPVFWAAFRLLPGTSLFRCPARVLILADFAVAIGAALGMEYLLASAGGSAGWRPGLRKLTAAALLVLVTGELAVHSHRVLKAMPAQNTRSNNPILRFIEADPGPHRVVAPQILLSDREAWSHRICKVQAYDPVPLRRFVAVYDAMSGGRDTAQSLMGFSEIELSRLRKNVVDLLGVRYAAVTPQRTPPGEGWSLRDKGILPPEFALVEPAGSFRYEVFENVTTLPRAFVVGRVRTCDPKSPDVLTLLAEFDPRQEILLADDVLPDGPRAEFQSAEIVEYTPNRVVIDVSLERPGYLFLSDTWYPGWTARDNGGPVAIYPGNLAFRAVPLDGGPHRVEFRFVPPELTGAVLVTLTSLLVAILLAVRRPRATPELSEVAVEL